MSQAPKQTTVVSMRRLFALVQPHRRLFLVGLFALTVAAVINLTLPACIRMLIDGEPLSGGRLYAGAVMLGGLFVVQAIAFYFRSLALTTVGVRVVEGVRKDLFRTLLFKEISFFDSARVGDLTSRLVSDVQLLQDAVSTRLSVFIRYAFQVLVGVGFMLWLSPILGVLVLLLVPLLVGISIFLGKKLKTASRFQQDALSDSAHLAEEGFSGIRSVRMLGAEEQLIENFDNAATNISLAGVARAKISGFFQSSVSLLMNVALVGVVAYGLYLVKVGSLTPGSLTAFLLYGATVAISFSFLSTGYTELVQSLGGVERIFALLDNPESFPELPSPLLEGITDSPSILLNHVHFAYPSRPDNFVVKDLSVLIPSKSFTAFVGYSGSGKSSFVALLSRFYQLHSGRIELEGVPLESIPKKTIAHIFSIVPQDPWIFSGTVKENLCFGNQVSDDRLQSIIDGCELKSFIDSLPNRLETMVGPKGVQLSGGQKQRIAMARALLRAAPVLILDEATSALDAETESRVMQTVRREHGGKTLIVIAHRLASIQNADVIHVMAKGGIIESGSHVELLAKESLYKDLVRLQQLSTI